MPSCPPTARLRLPIALAFLLSSSAPVALAASLPGGGNTVKQARPPAAGPSKASGKPGRGTTGKPSRSPTVVLYHVNRRETLRLRLVDDRGRSLTGMQRQMNQFLRCHYTNRRFPMNPRLTRLIYETGRNYPGRRIEVVSGYRHPRFSKNPRSPHMRGLATDIRVQGVKNTELRDFFRSRFQSVGVGFYPNSSFVHLDVRRGASAFWIDYSGPGESAQYASNALEDLRSGRADRWRKTTIDPSWADQDDVTVADAQSSSLIGASLPGDAASGAGAGTVGGSSATSDEPAAAE